MSGLFSHDALKAAVDRARDEAVRRAFAELLKCEDLSMEEISDKFGHELQWIEEVYDAAIDAVKKKYRE